jgi:hypothetical protein
MGRCHIRRWTDEILPLLTDDDPLGVEDLRTYRIALTDAPHGCRSSRRRTAVASGGPGPVTFRRT